MGDLIFGWKGKTPRLDLGMALIAAALLISVPRWIGAFEPVDGIPLTGLGQGLLLEGGAFYLISTWRRRKALAGARWLWAFFGLDLVMAPLIQTPHIVSAVSGKSLNALLSLPDATLPLALWSWAALVAAAPVLLVAGISYAYALEHRTLPAASDQERAQIRIERPGLPAPATPLLPAAIGCELCGREFGTKQALAAHGRAHKPRSDA